MTLGLHERRVRRRQKFWWGVFKYCFVLAIIIGLGVYSYLGGIDIAERKVQQQADRMAELEAGLEAAQAEKAKLERDLQAADRRAKDWESRYQKDVPSGPITELIALMSEKLADGTDAERLSYLIANADSPRQCDEPVTRRFLVATDFQGESKQSVGFANNTITVTASGESARDTEGNVQAWYDPAKEVRIEFQPLGAEMVAASGFLPLQHSMVERFLPRHQIRVEVCSDRHVWSQGGEVRPSHVALPIRRRRPIHGVAVHFVGLDHFRAGLGLVLIIFRKHR